MPAQTDNSKSQYTHVYNRGLAKINIFNDSQDFETFIGFLQEYLTPPLDPHNLKKEFVVNGRKFKGVPHQPKNYYKKLELVAYSLQSDHFHLIVRQIKNGSLEKLIRSLSTRYVIYYNKKYQRSGSLFKGPYKHVAINDASELLLLTRHLHKEGEENGVGYSSYKQYVSDNKLPWVKSSSVLSYFEHSKNDRLDGIDGYKKFVEVYKLSSDENELLNRVSIESLEKQDTDPILDPIVENEKQYHPTPKTKTKVPEFVTTSLTIFVVLFSLGIYNVNSSITPSQNQSASTKIAESQVSGVHTEIENDTSKPNSLEMSSISENKSDINVLDNSDEEVVESEKQVYKLLTIVIADGARSVNIRKEPTTESEIVSRGFDGDVFEFKNIATDPAWYEIGLDDGSSAFIASQYAQINQ